MPDVETCRGASPTPTRQYAPTYRRAAARLYHAAILRNIFHAANLLDEFISPTYIYNAPTTQFRCTDVPWRVSDPNPTKRALT